MERQKETKPEGSAENPVDTFMAEHEKILHFAEELNALVRKIKQAKDFNAAASEIKQLSVVSQNLLEAEKHHVREENVLFPYLEKHGITGPPAVMWEEHTQLRASKKKLRELLGKANTLSFTDFVQQLETVIPSLAYPLQDHIEKENNILYPMALSNFSESEWKSIKEECDELGYCTFLP